MMAETMVERASRDDLGDRMKAYEAIETSRRLDPHLPIYARIDGRSFSRFTRGMDRPFDVRLIDAMSETTKRLVHATHARIGYTQSDEISLVFLARAPESDVFFSGKVLKLASVLASLAAAAFARACPVGFEDRLPHFDCRVMQLPSRTEAANAILWRTLDARKNAISMVAQTHFSPARLHKVGQAGMLDMLRSIRVNFDCMDARFRSGVFVRRETEMRMLSRDELARIPEDHCQTGAVERTILREIVVPEFRAVIDREAFIFDAALAEPAKADT